METLVVNLSKPARLTTLNGRRYLVAAATLIVPGVVPGSQGPLLYTARELATEPSRWNGIPITLGHPKLNGEYISGRRPDILATHGLGWIYNATFDGKLRAEAWFDEELTGRLSPATLAALKAGQALELSTGLGVTAVAAPKGSVYNGTPYIGEARHHQPDHLAVLLDRPGACSLKQGCGVLVNSHCPACSPPAPSAPSPTCGGIPVNKDQLVNWLVVNCDHWKGQEVVLQGMEVPLLQKLKDVSTPAPAVTPTVNIQAPAPAPTTQAATTPAAAPGAPSGLATPVATPLTEDQWLASAPPRIRSAVQNALQIEQQERQRLVDTLTVNYADQPERRKQVGDQLFHKPIEELRLLVELMPAQVQNGGQAGPAAGYVPGGSHSFPHPGYGPPTYQGMAGGPYALTANEAADVLDMDAARAQYDPWARRPAGQGQAAGQTGQGQGQAAGVA